MLTAQSSLGIIFFPAFDWAISPTHPEREERLLYTQDQFREEGIFDIEGIREYRPLAGGRRNAAGWMLACTKFCIAGPRGCSAGQDQ